MESIVNVFNFAGWNLQKNSIVIHLFRNIFERKKENGQSRYWLRMQNEYYAIKETRSLNGLIKPMISKNRLSEYMCWRNELVENFLKPLGWELGQFADYIGFDRDTLLHVIAGRCQISIDLAVRFSEALGNHPMHWLDIQMKLNLQRILNNKTLIQKRTKIVPFDK